MNEIEVQKLLIKEAFNKHRSLPDFGNLGDDNTIKLRNCIWKICGSLDQEGQQANTQDKSHVTASKKNGLVAIYKLWSAFTKNCRYMIDQKNKAVQLPRFGTFARSNLDSSKVTFIPSTELANILEAPTATVGSFNEDVAGPEWQKIAPAANIPS